MQYLIYGFEEIIAVKCDNEACQNPAQVFHHGVPLCNECWRVKNSKQNEDEDKADANP